MRPLILGAAVAACSAASGSLAGGKADTEEPVAAATRENLSSAGPLVRLLTEELDYAVKNLRTPDGTKPYYLGYAVVDTHRVSIRTTLGTLVSDDENRSRQLDVDVRVGSHQLDNTHKIRGGGFNWEDYLLLASGAVELALDDDPDAIRHTLWLATDEKFKAAVKRFDRVKTNVKVKVEEEDKSNDFSREGPNVYFETPQTLALDRSEWARRLRNHSTIFREYPLVYSSGISLNAGAETKYLVTSEGTRLQTSSQRMRLVITAGTKADDGMELSQTRIFDSAGEGGLPDDPAIEHAVREVIDQVLALREAPLVEPYSGPAILRNRAAGVFFHEIFGHRIEGHRQKDVEEGQTFTKKIGQQILPEFLTVRDDPTRARFGDIDLRGHYKYDDEGVEAMPVTLVENGVLRTFLLSRSPVEGFPGSNGHGRRSPGHQCVSRQANLIVESNKSVPYDKLRQMLIDECKRQDKPYGLIFQDISGGFTSTRRAFMQSFKVLPIVVYRVYPDGRPDELVRGVDIVGTPLACFEKIVATGDDPAVFNGTCGAESGMVPVSAISPSLLVSTIEVEKRQREQSRPPILAPPIAEEQ